MKYKHSFVLLIGFFFFQACMPPVQFSEPQPTGEKNLEAFPTKLQGQYLSETDSSILTISEKIIVQHYHSLLKQSKNELDSLYQLIDDSTIMNRDTRELVRVKLNADTVIGYIDTYDTLFNVSAKNVLRKFSRFYFLNIEYSESWEVQMLNYNNRRLTLGTIPSKEGLDKLKEISTEAVDSASGNVQLTKDEFKEFVRQGGFYNAEEFVRMNR